MTRFFGKVGYGYTGEGQNGVWQDTIIEREHYGDVVRTARQLINGQQVNNDLTVNNSISIIADAFVLENMFAIRYVEWAGRLWTVPNVESRPPRLILTLGGVYDGPRPEAP